ncbi:MAG: T9SS type A sorting domain-containing protein [Chitinophagales bacterium]
MNRKLLLCFTLLICAWKANYAATGLSYQWAGPIHGVGSDEVLASTTDAAGNVYIAGRFDGANVDFDFGSSTTALSATTGQLGFLAKYNSSGQVLWAFSLNSTATSVINSLVVDASGNIYIAGNYTGTADFDLSNTTSAHTAVGGTDFFIAKYNTTANLQWVYSPGSSSFEDARAMCLDYNGNLIIAGTFLSQVDFDAGGGTANLSPAGNLDAYVLKITTAGVFSAVKGLGGIGLDEVWAITAGPAANDKIYLCGAFGGAIDFDWGAGTVSKTPTAGSDAYLLAVDKNLQYSWVNTFGGTSDDQGLALTYTPGNQILMAGYFQGTIDFDPSNAVNSRTSGNNGAYASSFVAAYSSTGNYVWTNVLTQYATNYNRIKSVAVNPSGSGVYVSGFSDDFDANPGPDTTLVITNSNEQGFIVKYNSTDGSLAWVSAIEGTCYANSLMIDANENIYAAGRYYGTTDFNPSPLTANLVSTAEDGFLARYSVCNFPAAPVVNPVADTICAGATFTFNAQGTGLVSWYYDTVGNSYFGANGYSMQYNNSSTYNYWAQDSSSSCGAGPRKRFKLTVAPNPTIFVGGASNSCTGDSVLIGAGGADTYLWDNLATTSTISVLPSPPSTTYTVIGFTNAGCSDTTDYTINVLDYPAPHINASSILVCAGAPVVLTLDTLIAGNYYWSTTETTDSITINPLQDGMYGITVENAYGCEGIDSIPISVSILVADINQTADTLSTSVLDVTYMWYNCGTATIIPAETSNTFVPTVDGSYAVIASSSLGCVDTSDCIAIAGLGIANNGTEAISLYPNPGNGVYTLQQNYGKGLMARLYNSVGQLMETYAVETTEFTFNIQGLAPGIYNLLLLHNNEPLQTLKLLKQ